MQTHLTEILDFFLIPSDTDAPVINYDKLKWLCEQDGLRTSIEGGASSEEAHKTFMENYKDIFVDNRPQPSIPLGTRELQISKSLGTTNISTGGPTAIRGKKKHVKEEAHQLQETESHNIKEHMAKLHRERKIVDPVIIQANRIRDLRTILKKLPYERKAEENDVVYSHLKTFPDLAQQLTNKELKELCTVAQLDVWRDEGYTVFSNSGFYIILKGSVVPQNRPWVRYRGRIPLVVTEPAESRETFPELKVGDCFGTLERLEGDEPNSRVLTVTIKSVPTEFLKISSNDFKRITEQIREQETSDKVALIQSCKVYNLWPRQSLQKLAELLEWTTFPENTVLVTEGYLCPFIGFVKSGECHVLRQVEVKVKLPNGKEENKNKQVVMGRLTASESFGEISVLKVEPINSSVVTATNVELGVISLERIKELDDTTRSLLLQSNEHLYESLSETDIHNEYIDQEQKREWNQFKHKVVVDVINSRGIRPGCGKWAK